MNRWLPAPEPTVAAALAPWRQVAARADAFFARVRSSHGDRMRCGPGCTDCCHPDLSLLYCEAVAILLALSALAEEEIEPLRRAAGDPSRRHCPLLVPRGLCVVHPMRPMVCRTHGLPVLEEGEVSLCPLNFRDGIIPEGVVLDGTLLTAQLTVADGIVRGEDLATCRVSIAHLLLEGAAALPTPRR